MSITEPLLKGNEANKWRLKTPGSAGWQGSAEPTAANKYLMISTDTHMNEPTDIFASRIPAHLVDRLPMRVVVDPDGTKWEVTPGLRKVKWVDNIVATAGDDEDRLRNDTGRKVDRIVADMDQDGIDIQIAFPNKGMSIFASNDQEVMYPMAAIFNDWLAENFAPAKDRILAMPIIPPQNVDLAIKELERVAKMGIFRGIFMPTKPVFGPLSPDQVNYNHPMFDPLWARLQEMNMPITIHIATGQDPRTSKGHGNALINYSLAIGSAQVTIANLLSSGVLDRFPRLRFATIESGIGWVPWLISLLDEGYHAHHFWVRPKLKKLPSEYYYESFFSTFQEDPAGLFAIDPKAADQRFRPLENCYMWANDYPHHEGTWPHSKEAVERQLGHLTEEQRRKILGENAVRFFNIKDLADKRMKLRVS